MKKTKFFIFLLVIFSTLLFAKDVNDSKKSKLGKVTLTGQTARMNINRVDLAVTNDGQTGNDADSFYPNGTDLSFIFSGGPVMSGYVNGSLRTAWMAPASRIQELQPGNAGTNPDAAEFVFYTVNGSDAQGSENYIKWADAVAIGADFYDADGDGAYDPNIDKPDIIGDRTLWCVYNDGVPASSRDVLNTQALGIEVRQSIWAFQRSDALGDVVFIRYSVVNVSGNDIDDMIISGWTDPDLGTPTDDLIGCDTTLSMGYIYNFQDDGDYGLNPPAFGIDFFQGAIIDAPGDTAFNFRGPLLGVDTLLDMKNLPLTSFMYYENGGNILPGPTNKDIARNYQLGGLDANSDPVVPQDWGAGGDASSNEGFFFSGDPVTGSGWVDTNPADKRFMVNNGPFQLKAGDRQDIVMAYVVAQSGSALQSLDKLKTTDELAQASYDNNFLSAPPIPVPDVTVRTGDKEIELIIDYSESFNFSGIQDVVGEIDFEGFEIYQFNSLSTQDEVSGVENAKIIARFDLDNDVGDLYIDDSNGERIKVWEKQSGDNSLSSADLEEAGVAIQRLKITNDAFNLNEPLVNAKQYYFAVVPFGINKTLAFENDNTAAGDDLVLPGGLFASNRISGFIRATPGTSVFAPFNADQANKSSGESQGSVSVDVVDRGLVTGDEYEVSFFDDAKYWKLMNKDNDVTLLDSMTFQGLAGTEWSFPIVDGLSVRVYDVDERAVSVDTSAAPWLIGANESSFSDSALYDDGVDLVKHVDNPFTLTDWIRKEEYFPVRVVFDTTDNSKFGAFLRGNFSRYRRKGDTFVSAYDMSDADNPRKLNLCAWAPSGATLYTETSGPILYIMTSDYDSTDIYNPTRSDSRVFTDEAYMAVKLFSKADSLLQSNIMTLDIEVNYPNTDLDVFRFESAELVTELSTSDRKGILDKVRIVPNPYYGYSSYEVSYDAPLIKFTNVDKQATIRIFNLAGQLIKTIEKNDTNTNVAWNLRNEANLKVASGMYIAHIEVPGVGEKILKFGIVQREDRIDRF
ncbi:MAG: T9SS C-terminal target domain-containing protein [Calditrichaeota bacterium]|nr:T9SS C-terminal target domain-containing protein [Calditrichota bacterium]NOG47383.1 T9SS type A sorting domain-containing protein [Calditrichota bacterium]